MFSIAGVPVLNPEEQFGHDKGPSFKHLYEWANTNKNLWQILKDLIKPIPRLDTLATKGHLLQQVFESIPFVGINELYWPVGAQNIGVAYVLLSEKAASLVFALSDALNPMDDNPCKSNSFCPLRGGEMEFCPPKPETPQASPGSGGASSFINTMIDLFPDDWNENEVRPLRPVPIMIWNRPLIMAPAFGTDFVRTAMYPLLYIPLTQFEAFALNPEFDGVGVLLLVDQRFLWRFMLLKDDYISHGSNKNYFNWYKIMGLILPQYLMSFQYMQPDNPTLNQKVWHDYIDGTAEVEEPDEHDPDQTPIVHDDRALMGPSVNLKTYGARYSIAEFFALIEQALQKRLVFKYGWQISFVNSIAARLLYLRNMVLFAPSFVYSNDSIFEELCVDDKGLISYKEKPIYQGGVPFYWNRFEVNEEGLITNIKLRLDARMIMPIPQRVRVFGDGYYTTSDPSDEDFGAEDWGLLAPFSVSLWSDAVVEADSNVIVPFGLFKNPLGCGGFLQAKARRYLKAPAQKTEYPIYTTCTALIKVSSNNEIQNNNGEENFEILNKKRVEAYAKQYVRNWLYWNIVPTAIQFKRICRWPLTGLEHAVRYDGVLGFTAVVPHTQQRYQPGGVAYSGANPPDKANVAIKHRLLSYAHSDTCEEKPIKNALIVGRHVDSKLPTSKRKPQSGEFYWHRLDPYELTQLGTVEYSNKSYLMVVGGYKDLPYKGIPPDPNQTPIYLPNSTSDDCTVTWWVPIMFATPDDPTPHLGYFKFEQSLGANSPVFTTNRNPTIPAGSIALINDQDAPGNLKGYMYIAADNQKRWDDITKIHVASFGPHHLLDGDLHYDTVAYNPTTDDYIYFDQGQEAWVGDAAGNGFLTYDENDILTWSPIQAHRSITSTGVSVELVGDQDVPISAERQWYFARSFTSFDTTRGDPGGGEPDGSDSGDGTGAGSDAPCSISTEAPACASTTYQLCQNMAVAYSIRPGDVANQNATDCNCDVFLSCPIVVSIDPSSSGPDKCVYKTAFNGCYFYGSPNPCGDGNWTAKMEITAGGNVTVHVAGPGGAGGQLNGAAPTDHTSTIDLTGQITHLRCGNLTNWKAKPYQCITKKPFSYDPCGNPNGRCAATASVTTAGEPQKAADDPNCNVGEIAGKCRNSYGAYNIFFSGVDPHMCPQHSAGENTVNTALYCDCNVLDGLTMTVFRWPCTCRYISMFADGNMRHGVVRVCRCLHFVMMSVNGNSASVSLCRFGSYKQTSTKYVVVATWTGNIGDGPSNLNLTAGGIGICPLPPQITVEPTGSQAVVGGDNINPFGIGQCTSGGCEGDGGPVPPIGDGPGENQMTTDGVTVSAFDCNDGTGGQGAANPTGVWGNHWHKVQIPVPKIYFIDFDRSLGGQNPNANPRWQIIAFVSNKPTPTPEYYLDKGSAAGSAGSWPIEKVQKTTGMGNRVDLAPNEAAAFIRIATVACSYGMYGRVTIHVPPPESQYRIGKANVPSLKLMRLAGNWLTDGNIQHALAVMSSTYSNAEIAIPSAPLVHWEPGYFDNDGSEVVFFQSAIGLPGHARCCANNAEVTSKDFWYDTVEVNGAGKSYAAHILPALAAGNYLIVPPIKRITAYLLMLLNNTMAKAAQQIDLNVDPGGPCASAPAGYKVDINPGAFPGGGALVAADFWCQDIWNSAGGDDMILQVFNDLRDANALVEVPGRADGDVTVGLVAPDGADPNCTNAINNSLKLWKLVDDFRLEVVVASFTTAGCGVFDSYQAFLDAGQI